MEDYYEAENQLNQQANPVRQVAYHEPILPVGITPVVPFRQYSRSLSDDPMVDPIYDPLDAENEEDALPIDAEPDMLPLSDDLDDLDALGSDDLGVLGVPGINLVTGEGLAHHLPADLQKGLIQQQQQQQQQANLPRAFNMPDVIRNFILYFYRCVKEQNLREIHSTYETNYNKLTDRYYKNSPWPPAEAIVPLVGEDPIFLCLYKELYYRHIYSKMTPQLTFEHRLESWRNYCTFFSLLLTTEPYLTLELPNQWLWDMIDEFIYQYQSFCQYRSKVDPKSEEGVFLKENHHVWNSLTVQGYLNAFIRKSNIISILERDQKRPQDIELKPEEYTPPIYRMLGYFSIVGLLRFHCLLGDYYTGLKTLDPIDLGSKGLFTRVTACHVTLYYYAGFAYLMLRRYVDCIKTLSNVLLYLSRTKQYHTRSNQFDQIIKKNDHMYSLLAIAVSLCPQRIDESIHNVLREKHGDKMMRMQRGDEACFKELFSSACPKFVSPVFVGSEDEAQEALRLQLKLFLNEVRQQSLISTIRSFLKLYTTIGTAKLANFLEIDEAALRTHLLCMKHKTHNPVWAGGSMVDGKVTSSSDVDFFVDKDMIHIANVKVSRRFGEFFMRHILKFEEIITELDGAKRS